MGFIRMMRMAEITSAKRVDAMEAERERQFQAFMKMAQSGRPFLVNESEITRAQIDTLAAVAVASAQVRKAKERTKKLWRARNLRRKRR